MTDLVPAHFVAVTLHPEMKYKYFESEWDERPDWIENAKSMVQRVWKTEYKPEATDLPETLLPITIPIRSPTADKSSLETLCDFGTLPNWKQKKWQRLIRDE